MEIRDFDLPRFGGKRLPWLLATMRDFPWQALMARDKRSGDVRGFVLGSERVMGPLVADDAETAAALLAACEAAGAPARIVLDDAHKDAARVLAEAGYAPDGVACARMVRGAQLPGRRETLYGIGAWAMG